MSTSERRKLSPEEIQRELAQILATGYLRLCEEARQSAEGAPSQQRSAAPEAQESASACPGERP